MKDKGTLPLHFLITPPRDLIYFGCPGLPDLIGGPSSEKDKERKKRRRERGLPEYSCTRPGRPSAVVTGLINITWAQPQPTMLAHV